MTTTNLSQIFKELCDLADSELDDQLPERVQQLKEQRIELPPERARAQFAHPRISRA